MSDDFETRVQRKAEQHLADCNEAAWWDETGEEGPPPESPAFGPYCGCDTCIVREVLSVCWEEMRAEAQREAHDAHNRVGARR